MFYLIDCRKRDNISLLKGELSYFFKEVDRARSYLNSKSCSLNRIQRERAKRNIYKFLELKREFFLVDFMEDYYHLYMELEKFLNLRGEDLAKVCAFEDIDLKRFYLI